MEPDPVKQRWLSEAKSRIQRVRDGESVTEVYDTEDRDDADHYWDQDALLVLYDYMDREKGE